jgi:hypothetical protein
MPVQALSLNPSLHWRLPVQCQTALVFNHIQTTHALGFCRVSTNGPAIAYSSAQTGFIG